MTPIVVDVETTTFQNGHVYAPCNRLCYVGLFNDDTRWIDDLDCQDRPYGDRLNSIRSILDSHDLFIAFNLKFDWNWLRRYGIHNRKLAVWDLQLAEFIISAQEKPMPSLEETLAKRGLPPKSKYIEETYWDKGVDTPYIPREDMVSYLQTDLETEWALFQWQLDYLRDKPQIKRLIWEACQDLKLTAEMEWNGLWYDIELSEKLGKEKLARIAEIDDRLCQMLGRSDLSWNSGDDISLALYGGTRLDDGWESYIFTYKDGRTAEKQRKCKVPVHFRRLVEPLKGTDLKKHGFFATDVGTLAKLKAQEPARSLIKLLLERSLIETQANRYLLGIPKLYREYQWQNNVIHGQLNHCVARTGRLSSSKPNQQNLDQEARQCLRTRFPKY